MNTDREQHASDLVPKMHRVQKPIMPTKRGKAHSAEESEFKRLVPNGIDSPIRHAPTRDLHTTAPTMVRPPTAFQVRWASKVKQAEGPSHLPNTSTVHKVRHHLQAEHGRPMLLTGPGDCGRLHVLHPRVCESTTLPPPPPTPPRTTKRRR